LTVLLNVRVKGLVKLAGLLIELAPHDDVQTVNRPSKKLGVAALVVPIILFKLTVALVAAFVVVAEPVVPPLGPFGTTLVAP
jgi:hypothetical protein